MASQRPPAQRQAAHGHKCQRGRFGKDGHLDVTEDGCIGHAATRLSLCRGLNTVYTIVPEVLASDRGFAIPREKVRRRVGRTVLFSQQFISRPLGRNRCLMALPKA